MIERLLQLPEKIEESFFLWGPRQSGKTTLLKKLYPDVLKIDLLKANEFRRYNSQPELLRTELIASKKPRAVIIDEIQKVPPLLDEVHYLIENENIPFVLCGSSARKLKRGHGNLLGGRAVRYELTGFSAKELGENFDLIKMLNSGYLPSHYLSNSPLDKIEAYIVDYLREEIAAEGIIRNLQAFSSFLQVASLSDTEQLSYSTIARDVGGISSETIKTYFEILEDTLVGRLLPSFQKRPKRRVVSAPKFFFFDVGIVNLLAKRGKVAPQSELFGKAFENWVFHEISTYIKYYRRRLDLSFWKLSSGIEVDFIVGDMGCAIESKATSMVRGDHLKGLRALVEDHPECKKRIVVSLDEKKRVTEDGILIIPYSIFIEELWKGEIF